MQLDQQFTIPVDVETTWAGLLDITRVAAAFPGATLTDHTGDSFTGTVKVKLGPVGLTYRGKATFTEVDETAHRVAIVASGSDVKGNGNASADVHATLTPGPDGSTVCALRTNLEITGKAAQFGRGLVVDIGNRVLTQFARNLEKSFDEPEPEPDAATTTETAAATPRDGAVPLRTATPVPVPATDTPDQLDALDLVWSSPLGRRGLLSTAALLLAVFAFVLGRRTVGAR
ncbi:SRPBCC family protein [Pseudonocardia dioxanivorans]|uniref:SRPBCC family protein n=1 Tax=Pseudonocardia dioxanivorans TaxID=240495 RepID=UPI00131A5A3C|nr:SRPBCC family protein [Pseudonocardia dioxanivorans]